MALISSAGRHCNCDKQEWEWNWYWNGGGWEGGTWSPQYYGRIRIMSYLLCSAIDIAHQIHPITCSCENSDRDQHTLIPSLFFLAHPQNDNGMSSTCTEGYLFHSVKCSEDRFFFGAQTRLPSIGRYIQNECTGSCMSTNLTLVFWRFLNNAKRKNYGDTTLSYSISRRDYQA